MEIPNLICIESPSSLSRCCCRKCHNKEPNKNASVQTKEFNFGL